MCIIICLCLSACLYLSLSLADKPADNTAESRTQFILYTNAHDAWSGLLASTPRQ